MAHPVSESTCKVASDHECKIMRCIMNPKKMIPIFPAWMPEHNSRLSACRAFFHIGVEALEMDGDSLKKTKHQETVAFLNKSVEKSLTDTHGVLEMAPGVDGLI
jgi:hypothetical protein